MSSGFFSPGYQPVFRGLIADTYKRAFIINALVIGFTVALTAFMGGAISGDPLLWKKVVPQVLTAVATAWISFVFFRWLTGFGGGMLANPPSAP